MKITINCTEEEYEENFKHLKINNLIVQRERKKETKPSIKRLDFLLEHIKYDTSLEVLYRTLRKKGFPKKKKTFVRDFKKLEKAGHCKLEVITGGIKGTYTTIRR